MDLEQAAASALDAATGLAAEVLGLAEAAPSQASRLLRLSTPLGEGLLVAEEARVHEVVAPDAAVPAGWRIELHASSVDTHLALKSLIGQPVLLQLLLADGSLRPWHGHVTTFALLGSEGGLARYRLVIEPWFALLAHRHDSWVFQDMSVREIVDEVLGRLPAATATWRWDLADETVYARRSLCIQYAESDLDFVLRLLREEGLFFWFEHEGDLDAETLGTHTLVLADHNGAFAASAQPEVRYTQSGATLAEDSLDRWREGAASRSARLDQASRDYRSLGLRPVSQVGNAPGAGDIEDVPGLYAYEDSPQGERLALRQMQALDALREDVRAQGSLRSAAPGSAFTLFDHSRHDGSDADRDTFVVLGAQHRIRSNVRADARAGLGAAPVSSLLNETDPVYRCELALQRLALPVRRAALDARGQPDVRLSPRPTVRGVQTAVVVGTGPIHTDRDHRIKLQFHWQRGASGSHRLEALADNALASDASGTWVRVAQSVAGANWGQHFVPRVGQEVLVAFVGGDIDRPVVVGSLFNGRGSANAQGNEVAAGMAGASGNAPMWFPGDAAEGDLQAHQHPHVLSGHKSQELVASASGTGGSNQLVFDDSPGQGRIELSSSSAQTRLQLGHLLHQVDNRRLQPRGHGIDLATAAWGAVRAGSGLLLSAHGRNPEPQSLDAAEARAQLQAGQDLIHTLAQSALAQGAALEGEADLPVEQALAETAQSLQGTQTLGDAGSDIGGGHGSIAAWERPDLLVSAPAGVVAHTPAACVATAGHTASLAAEDIQHLAQGHHAQAAKAGLVLYTYGQAGNPNKPNQETGLRLHAATGSVNTQSQSAATRIAADQAVEVASTQGMVRITAPEHVLLTAGGSAVQINGADITLSSPGDVVFKASLKEWAGGGSAGAELLLPHPIDLATESGDQFFMLLSHEGAPIANRRYRARTGNMVIEGFTDAQGTTSLLDGYVGQLSSFELIETRFDTHFVVQDVEGRPMANFPYVIQGASGLTLKGVTDEGGRTACFTSEIEEHVELLYALADMAEDEGGD